MMNQRLAERVTRLEQRLAAFTSSLETRIGRLEQDQGATHDGVVGLQGEVERLREQLLPGQQERLDRLEQSLREQQQHLEQRLDQVQQQSTGDTDELRQQLAAARQQCDHTVARLAGDLAELTTLVERVLQQQPLPAPVWTGPSSGTDQLAAVQPLLVQSFRGSGHEIRSRLEPYVELLSGQEPVLDLGAGRGELLLLLEESGIAASGIEADPALVEAARRRRLTVLEGDVLELIQAQPSASWGAVTAFHLLEHLPPAQLLQALAEVRRILRDGGLLLVESPNPHSLRVGASLYWLDPTHQHPLLPETLALFLKASGFVIEQTELLHPFPPEQQLWQPGPEGATGVEPQAATAPALGQLHQRLDQLCQRLDELLNGHRDFLIRARKPGET